MPPIASSARRSSLEEPRRPSRVALGAVAMAGILGVVIWLAVAYANLYAIQDPDHSGHLPAALQALTWILVGAFAWNRRPANPLGRWMIVVGFLQFVYVLGLLADPLGRTIADRLAYLPIVVIAYVFLAFPDGHLRDRTDRALVSVVVATWAVTALLQGLLDPTWLNLMRVIDDPALFDTVAFVSGQSGAFLTLVVGAHVVQHWRRETPAGRRVMTPLLWALIPYLVLVLLDELALVLPNPASDFGGDWMGNVIEGFALPVCFLLGILRTNLARASLADVMRQLDAGVEPGRLNEILQAGLGDPTLWIAYPRPDGGWVDGAGTAVEPLPVPPGRAVTPVGRGDPPSALLVHDAALSADPTFVTAVGSAARLAIENERLQAEVRAQLEEVRASRGRIVEAGIEARRKVERDLHDGAQQRLLALSVRLQLARQAADGGTPVATQLDSVNRDLQAAIAELRALARGVHPPGLVQGGLASAAQDLADGAHIPVAVSVTAGRCTPVGESAAYFVIAEALANIMRHARAHRAEVRVDLEDAYLVVRVTDDGVGGADPKGGSGLRGLADRVDAVGGRLDVDSPAGGGTRLTARIPCG